jgi:hypothetical protein
MMYFGNLCAKIPVARFIQGFIALEHAPATEKWRATTVRRFQMPLRARVGRHANTGAQCQNWMEDQFQVTMSLNFIPAVDGGAGGSISIDHVVGGIASDALCKAILHFQEKHFPTQKTGFVDPGGELLTRMETLASRPVAAPPAAPASTGQWGEFQSGSVQRALGAALSDSHFLSHVMVVEILRATLSNGVLSTNEVADLQMLAEKSRSIMPRSKTLLDSFVKMAKEKLEKLGPYILNSSGIFAANRVCDFLKLRGRGKWPELDRDDVGVGILMRLGYPGLLRQGGANLCGPAAMLFNVLHDHPATYAQYAIDLYERGESKLNRLTVKPMGVIRRSYDASRIDAVDWLTMASLRSSENWYLADALDDPTGNGLLGTPREGLFGATTQMEMAWWFDQSGYHDIREDANIARHQRDTSNMDEASRLFDAGYRVCLLIDGQMVETSTQSESGSMILMDRHWIVLRSRIDRSGGNVKMHIFTWGEGYREVPASGTLPLDDFMMNYYGYVAAMP